MKSRLESLADRVSDLAGHRYAWPLVAAAWLLTRDQALSDGVQLLLMFVLLNVQAREGAAIHLKLDALVKDSGASDELAGLEREEGMDDIDRKREEL